MRIHEVWPIYFHDAREFVDLTGQSADLRLPDGVRQLRTALDDVGDVEFGPGTALVMVAGPDADAHASTDTVASVLRRMRPGATALVMLGWPVAELPYHLLLDPLREASCQVVAAIPLEQVKIPDVRGALVVHCVDKLVPLRPYLVDARADAEPSGVDPSELSVMLRMVNEYVLSDLVSRGLRARLVEQERQLADLRRRNEELNRKLSERRGRSYQRESDISERSE